MATETTPFDWQEEYAYTLGTTALVYGVRILQAQFLSGAWATVVNGWRYPPPIEGHAGDNFLVRAADQSLAGIVANDPAEAVYLVNMQDADGRALAGTAPTSCTSSATTCRPSTPSGRSRCSRPT